MVVVHDSMPRNVTATHNKWNPQATGPDMLGYSLHPLRDDVPLLDPCSGFMSAGGDADLRPGTGKSIPCLVDDNDVKPVNSDPWGQRTTCKTAPPGGRAITNTHKPPGPRSEQPTKEMKHLIHKEGTVWNCVSRSDAALRAKLGGWTSDQKVFPKVPRGSFLGSKFDFKDNPRDALVHKCTYTSTNQRSNEDVQWDIKLPPKLLPPESTFEKMADPISQHFTLKRYEPKPEIWQVAYGMWDRFQTRQFHGQKKPLTFITPYPRKDHIPGYSGFTGSLNTEDIDNPGKDFKPFTKLRTLQPRDTSTAHTPNIPGYTGRVHWIAIHPANSNLPSPPSDADKKMNGSPFGSRSHSAFKQRGRLSKMVTTVPPRNPFNKVEK